MSTLLGFHHEWLDDVPGLFACLDLNHVMLEPHIQMSAWFGLFYMLLKFTECVLADGFESKTFDMRASLLRLDLLGFVDGQHETIVEFGCGYGTFTIPVSRVANWPFGDGPRWKRNAMECHLFMLQSSKGSTCSESFLCGGTSFRPTGCRARSSTLQLWYRSRDGRKHTAKLLIRTCNFYFALSDLSINSYISLVFLNEIRNNCFAGKKCCVDLCRDCSVERPPFLSLLLWQCTKDCFLKSRTSRM